MRLGIHVSIAGGFLEALERAKRLSCRTMQIFSRNPRGGEAPTISSEESRAFHQARLGTAIEPLAVHCPYIINLASPDARVWTQSVELYREELARCAALRADYLVTHVGSHRGDGEEAGIARVCKALDRALSRQSPVMILLENTAGTRQGLGSTFEQLKALRDGVRRSPAVGICLDTAHLFAAGFSIHTEEGLEEVLERFDRIVGLEHLKLIHLNDSRVGFHSHLDRHWHIGKGHIGLNAMRRLVNHPRLRGLPFILETPKKSDEDDAHNLEAVRRLVEEVPAPITKAL